MMNLSLSGVMLSDKLRLWLSVNMVWLSGILRFASVKLLLSEC